MFIRPVGVTVQAISRPAGRPLLRGLLARATGASAGAVGPDEAPRRGLLARAVQAAEVRSGGPAPQEPPEPPEPAEREASRPEPEPAEAFPSEARTEPHPAAGLAAELRQLADLAREGLLTPQEFTQAKARLLRN